MTTSSAANTHDFLGTGSSQQLFWNSGGDGTVELWNSVPNQTTPTTTAVGTVLANQYSFVGTGDITGSGETSIIWQANLATPNVAQGEIVAWTWNSTKQAFDAQDLGAANGYHLDVVADLDGNGAADLWFNQIAPINANSTNNVIWQMTKTGTTTAAILSTDTVTNINGGTGVGTATGSAGNFDFVGSSGVAHSNTVGTSVNDLFIAVGDFDKDGRADIAALGSATGGHTWNIWSVNFSGNSAFVGFTGNTVVDPTGGNVVYQGDQGRAAINDNSGTGGSFVLAAATPAGDFNKDGTQDIVWDFFDGTNTNIVITNMVADKASGTPVFVGAATGAQGWADVNAAGDYNKDGTTDFVWFNSTTGTVELWNVVGDQISSQVAEGQAGATWHLIA